MNPIRLWLTCFPWVLAYGAQAWAGSAGFAGIAAGADSAETASNNPAGMARLDAPAATVSLLLATGIGEFKVDDQKTTSSGGDPENNHDPVFVPQAYYVYPFTERLHAGISLTVPSGFGSQYGSNWAGRYYTDSYSLVYLAVTPALSWRLNEQWSIGASVGINYSSSESEVAINTLQPGQPDGRLEASLDGVGTNYSLSLLWEMSEQTRFGLVYTSEAKTDIEGKLKFRNEGPVLGSLLERGVIGDKLKVEQVMPQRIIGGVYHTLDSGAFVTADLGWIEFSRFGAASVSLDGDQLRVEDSGYNNLWAGAIGYGFPLQNRLRYTLDAFYVQAPVSDDKRTLALPLDRTWGVGAGIQIDYTRGRQLDLDIHLVDLGEAPVDTGHSIFRGRVAGKTENPYALLLSGAYHF